MARQLRAKQRAFSFAICFPAMTARRIPPAQLGQGNKVTANGARECATLNGSKELRDLSHRQGKTVETYDHRDGGGWRSDTLKEALSAPVAFDDGSEGQLGGRRLQSLHSEVKLELTAIADRALGYTFVLGLCFKCHSHFLGALECSMNISILRAGIERYQPIAVLAVRLEAIADFLRPLSEYLRAFGAFNFYFFVNHEMSLISMPHSAFQSLRACLGIF
jgi:hypothetical protein